jgi:hypothetical protein
MARKSRKSKRSKSKSTRKRARRSQTRRYRGGNKLSDWSKGFIETVKKTAEREKADAELAMAKLREAQNSNNLSEMIEALDIAEKVSESYSEESEFKKLRQAVKQKLAEKGYTWVRKNAGQ